MKSVLVTGGAGYVGAHCCKALRTAGYLPVVVDNLSTGHENFVRWGPFVRADVRDTSSLVEVFQTHNVSAVLHFAASSYVGKSVIDPQKYYENNLDGALSLLRAMRRTSCGKVSLLQHVCHIWRACIDPHPRGCNRRTHQSLRRLEGDGGAHAWRLCARLWHELRGS